MPNGNSRSSLGVLGGENDSAELVGFVGRRNKRLQESAVSGLSLSLFKWDATCLPLRDQSVDAVVSDVPYGKRHGSKQDNRRLYPQMLQVCMTRNTVLRTHKY